MSKGYEKTLLLGCCNYVTAWGDKAANLNKITGMVEDAARTGVGIVAFPELALSGYECDSPTGCGDHGMHKTTAETVPGPSTEQLSRVAKANNIYVIVGMPERDADNAARVYISAAVIGPEGILGTYRKLNLASPGAGATEQFCFTGGAQGMQEIPVFETRYGKVGVTICYDFWKFPEITRIQRMKGARLLINITAAGSSPGGDIPLQMMLVTGARAHENCAFAGTAGLTGKERTKSYYGHSTIAGPAYPRDMRIYAEGGGGEEMVTAALNFEQLDRTCRRRPLLEDREKYSAGIIAREFSRLLGDSKEQTRNQE